MSKRFVSLLLALALLCMAMSALGEQEAVEITVGSTNQMSGHFFTDMWGNQYRRHRRARPAARLFHRCHQPQWHI